MQDDEHPAGEQLQEEPQQARGETGSRDEGGPPASGPTDRPTGTSDAEDSTSVHPQEPIDEDMPTMQMGDQGG